MFRNVRRASAVFVGLLTAVVLFSQAISPTVASAAPTVNDTASQDAQFIASIKSTTDILPANSTAHQENAMLGHADFVCWSVRHHVPGQLILSTLAATGAPEGDPSNPLQSLNPTQVGQFYASSRLYFCPDKDKVVEMGVDGL